MRRWVLFIAVIGIASVSSFKSSASTAAGIEVFVGASKECFCAEVADDEAARQEGLSPDGDPAPFDAMLFQWDDLVKPSFWMKDTQGPLEVAFVGRDGVVATVAALEECGEAGCGIITSPIPVSTVIEAPDLAAIGIVEGVSIRLGARCTVKL
jgi:uncharacterized membrane protein (UPF0127 family)